MPRGFAHMGALGAAAASSERAGREAPAIAEGPAAEEPEERAFPSWPPLTTENVVFLRDRVQPPPKPEGRPEVFLGIDIGSVSTNFAVTDWDGNLLKEIYVGTQGRPVQVVTDGLKELRDEFGDTISIRGVGTTGSGRELIGELVGADTVQDEITAHKTGSTFISRRYFDASVDTIFEIGGQDSKFIGLENGVVTDFAMNDACAAGTGSFLEEQAERLGIRIKGEFAEMALSSSAPVRMGERCTVFMEQDLNNYLYRGARKHDLVAGLAYSVVMNYLNRVVRGRKIGETIYFQGGTAYNDAVAAAFSQVLGRKIIVPPHNGVIGAIGMALLARDKVRATKEATTFRGFDLSKVDYRRREFVCKGCSNYCDMQEIRIGDSRTYWGDKCSEKYRKAARTGTKPVIDDLVARRIEWLDRLVAETPAKGPARDRRVPPGDVFPRAVPLLEGGPHADGVRRQGVAAHRQGDRPRGVRADRRRAVLPDPGGPRARGSAAGVRRRLPVPAERDQLGDGPHPHGVAILPVGADAAVRRGRRPQVGEGAAAEAALAHRPVPRRREVHRGGPVRLLRAAGRLPEGDPGGDPRRVPRAGEARPLPARPRGRRRSSGSRRRGRTPSSCWGARTTSTTGTST